MAHIVVSGVREFNAALEGITAKQREATKQATAKILHMLEREAKAQLTTSSHPRGTPTPSAPGEPPSLITGNLRRSVRVTGPTAVGPTGWEGSTGPTAIYGRIQELGGITGRGTLPARPYMQPAWDKVYPQMIGIYRAAWNTALL